jgi:hypothetical protein
MAVASHFFAEPALGFRKRSRLPTRAYQVGLTWLAPRDLARRTE